VVNSTKDILRLAPMMGYTSAPFRLLLRLLAPEVQLYTEMVSVNAVVHHPQAHYFSRFAEEENTVFQLGGDHPKHSAEVAKQAEQSGFTEININCGCPSNRVQNANFGACLMRDPERVGEMVQEMQKKVSIPISIKHRLGIDKIIDYEFVHNFVKTIYSAGCRRIIVHSRNAWLEGLSPRLNRKVPPLRPQLVYQLKKDFPDMNVCINGEINTVEKVLDHLTPSKEYHEIALDGVMIGRKIWDNPYLFAHIQQEISKNKKTSISCSSPIISPNEIIVQYFQLVQKNYHWIKDIWSVNTLMRPLTHLYHGRSGAKQWRTSVTKPYSNLKEAESLLTLSNQLF
jgi:tRNA-dihydrouridine synthase A